MLMPARPERSHDAYMLLQPVHGAGPADCQRAQRRRLHGYVVSLVRFSRLYFRAPRPTARIPARPADHRCERNLDITMYETLLRPHQVDAPPPLTPIGEISAKLKSAEARREEKRLRQIANSRAAARRKRKRDGENEGVEEDAEIVGKKVKAGDGGEQPAAEQVVLEAAEAEQVALEAAEVEELGAAEVAQATPAAPSDPISADPVSPAKIGLSKAFPEVRGHTSYLTFACLLPAFVSAVAGPEEGAPASDTQTAAGPALSSVAEEVRTFHL